MLALDTAQPVYIRVHVRHLIPETLDHYNLLWERDSYDENYLIIKEYISHELQRELFQHTKRILTQRENRVRAAPTILPLSKPETKRQNAMKPVLPLTETTPAPSNYPRTQREPNAQDIAQWTPEDLLDDAKIPDVLWMLLWVMDERKVYKLELPAYSIAEETITVGDLRSLVAEKMRSVGVIKGSAVPDFKMSYKREQLLRDDLPIRKYGCKQNSEISIELVD